jgi:hypothetical protein
MSSSAAPGGRLPRIRGTQIGLRDPTTVDHIKRDMLAGRYAYEEPRGRIGGILDLRGTYHVGEGHHRMCAALEILRETGDDRPVRLLLQWGDWEHKDRPPTSRPMPARHWWGRLLNRLGI